MRLRAVLIAALTGAAPAASAVGLADFGPCYQDRDHVDDYAAAFVAEGWTLPQDEAASRAVGEILWSVRGTPARFGTAAEMSAFLERAWEFGADRRFVLTKGDASLGVIWQWQGRAILTCGIAAPHLADVEAADPPRTGDDAYFMEVLRVPYLPQGIDDIRAEAVRMDYSFATDPPPAGRDGLMVTIFFEPRS